MQRQAPLASNLALPVNPTRQASTPMAAGSGLSAPRSRGRPHSCASTPRSPLQECQLRSQGPLCRSIRPEKALLRPLGARSLSFRGHSTADSVDLANRRTFPTGSYEAVRGSTTLAGQCLRTHVPSPIPPPSCANRGRGGNKRPVALSRRAWPHRSRRRMSRSVGHRVQIPA